MNRNPQADRPRPPHPPVDLIWYGDHLEVTLSLPGVKGADCRISLEGGRQLLIEGEVPYRSPVPRQQLTAAERTYGPFSRTIPLPFPVDPSGSQVTFANGVMTLRLPVRRQPLPIDWRREAEA